MLRRLAALLALALLGAAEAGRAQLPSRGSFSDLPIELRAAEVEYDARRDVYVARGDVHLVQGERSIRADWAAFSAVTGLGVASGDVVYEDGGDTLHADFVEFDAETLQGLIFDGRFVSERGFRARGDEIAKTGEDEYRFEEGAFTTCRCPDPEDRDPWTIEASEAELEVGGYGTARNTSFEVLGVPVVWLPWMIYPLKTERQTGFLFPEIGLRSGNGFEFGLPFFWAARHDLGVTFTPRYMTKRGAKGDVKVEYVLGEQSEGEVSGAFVLDREIDANSVREPYSDERWALEGRQDLFLPAELRLKADFRFLSDNAYPNDFDDFGVSHQRFLESTAFASRSFLDDRFGASAAAWYADDLQNPDDADRDEFLLQRLPSVELAALPGPLPLPVPGLSRLAPALDVELTNFFSEGLAQGQLAGADELIVGDDLFVDAGIDALPDAEERGPGGGPKGGTMLGDDPNADNAPGGPENDGIFQEGEPLADRGRRALLHPRLGLPLRLFDAFELAPEVGWHQTLYDSRAQGFEERGFLTARAELRTRLQRRFGDALHHVAEPFASWALVTGSSDAGNPLYVPGTAVPQRRIRQLSLDAVTRDPADRIDGANRLVAGFANRMYAGGGEVPALVADFTLAGLYDFEEGDVGAVFLDGRAYPWRNAQLRFDLGVEPEDVQIDEALAELDWGRTGGHGVSFGYRYLRTIPRFFEDFGFEKERFDEFEDGFSSVNQVDLGMRVVLGRWTVRHRLAHSFEEGTLLSNQASIEYLSQCDCWAAGIALRQDRTNGIQVSLLYRLVGLGDDRGWRVENASRMAGPGFLDAL